MTHYWKSCFMNIIFLWLFETLCHLVGKGGNYLIYCLIGKKWYHYSIYFLLPKFLDRLLQFFLQVLFNSHYVPAFGHHVYHFFASEFKMDLHFFGYVHLFFKVRSYSALLFEGSSAIIELWTAVFSMYIVLTSTHTRARNWKKVQLAKY